MKDLQFKETLLIRLALIIRGETLLIRLALIIRGD